MNTKKAYQHWRLLTACGFFVLMTALAEAGVIFQDTFTNPGTSQQNLTTYGNGWAAYAGTSGADITSIDGTASNDSVAVSNLDYLFSANNAVAAQSFAAIDTFSAISVANGSTISWYMGNNSELTTVRLLVKVGGNWYASSVAFQNTSTNKYSTGSAFSTDVASTTAPSFSLTFSTDASNWRAFTLNPNSSMQLGAQLASPLPTNDITGIGFYVTTAFSSPARFDSLLITSVPEPSVYALLALGLVSVVIFQKKRWR